MTAKKLAAAVAAIIAMEFVIGLLFQGAPFALSLLLAGLSLLAPMALAAYSSELLRRSPLWPFWTFLVSTIILWVAFVGVITGEYVSYRLEFWGLSYSNYGLGDMESVVLGEFGLRVTFAFFPTAVVLGAVVAILGPVVLRVTRSIRKGPAKFRSCAALGHRAIQISAGPGRPSFDAPAPLA